MLKHHLSLRKEFPVRARRAEGLVKEVANLAGLTKDITPHVLRHAFTATALEKGSSLATVQKILGHDRLQTTAIYRDGRLVDRITGLQPRARYERALEAAGAAP